MASPSLKEEILSELDRMPVESQRRVLDLTRNLSPALRRAPVADPLPFVRRDRESPRRGRPISLCKARRLALGAMERAEERWHKAAEAEARFFDQVLGELEETGPR